VPEASLERAELAQIVFLYTENSSCDKSFIFFCGSCEIEGVLLVLQVYEKQFEWMNDLKSYAGNPGLMRVAIDLVSEVLFASMTRRDCHWNDCRVVS
jgi:hypothetical protein